MQDGIKIDTSKKSKLRDWTKADKSNKSKLRNGTKVDQSKKSKLRDGFVSCGKSPNCKMEWRRMENIQIARWNLELLKESKLRDRTLKLHFLFISKSKKLKSASSTLAIWLESLTFGTASGTRFCLDLPCLEEIW